MKKYILTLDEGTTSARTILFDKNANIVSVAQKEFTQIYPKPSFVEHNPIEIYSAQYSTLSEAIILAEADPKEIAAIGITNQRETTVIWDKNTGEPIYNAIVWQCRRTADICEKLKENKEFCDYVKDKTGLLIDAYFSATKIKWVLDNVEGARKKAENGELLFGTVDTWLMWKLSDGKIHATDTTNASRTMLFDIHTLSWDERLLSELGIPYSMMPKVLPSGSLFGFAKILGEEIPICSVVGDQQAALFGQRCFNCGDVKNTYGTGCFLLMNTGERAVTSQNNLITTVAATLDTQKTQYALEGSVFVGGAVIQWLRDQLNLITTAAETENIAFDTPDSEGVYIVPAFAGLGAPYWEMYATGTICGLTRGSSKNHIIRAALDSIAYQTNDLISAMREDSGIDVNCLKADGGAARNSALMQFQADISGINIIAPQNAEATALGACFIAGLKCGFYKNFDYINNLNIPSKTYLPIFESEKRNSLLLGWKKAVNATKAFCKDR